jgi:hypothetical protein
VESKTSVPTGYVLFEASEFVVIATLESENEKTGNMIQIWILNRHVSPVEAVKTGLDASVCIDCVHRGTAGFADRTCYVNVAQGPGSVWRAYRAGKYPVLSLDEYAGVFSGRKVRFGAYGEPVLIPVEIVSAISGLAKGHTGYTHQWRKAQYASYRPFLMASCDSAMDASDATAAGWRHFRVRSESEQLLAGEIICPASDEAGKRTQCIRCTLCDGKRTENDVRKNIVIIVHGIGAKNFVGLNQIAPAA